jgi:hypothetical protein
LPPGGFFVFALFIALNLYIKSRLKEPVDDQGFGCCKPDGHCAAAECGAIVGSEGKE